MLDLSSLLFALFWEGCKKIFFSTPFSTGIKHWISYSPQPFLRREPSCLRLVKALALGLDFTCSGMCERAITDIVRTVGRQSVYTELSWKMHGYTGHIYICVCVYVHPCMVPCSVSPGVFTELRALSPDSWNLFSGRDCSDVAGPLLRYHALPLLWLVAPSEVSQSCSRTTVFKKQN